MVKNKGLINREEITRLFGLRSHFFAEIMRYLEKEAILKKEKFDEKLRMLRGNIFKDSSELNSNLFLRYTYFALLLKALLIIKLSNIQNLDFEECYEDNISNNLEALHIFEFDYFFWTDFKKKAFEQIYNALEFTKFAQQDLFIDIYQQIFFSVTRHKIGEFYTPSNLVRLIVDDYYELGSKILDPSCGSGNFLIDIILKIINSKERNNSIIDALNNVYGFDINPLAVMTSKINILLIYLESFDVRNDEMPNLNIFLLDSLFPDKYENQMFINLKNLYNSFDLIIGNPPWLTYKDLENKDYQTEIRNLASKLKIKPPSQYITHIELATIFFYQIPLKFLKIGGKIFFVITKSVLNGDHCYEFRSFSLFNKNLEIWDFPDNYFFNIHHVCLKAEYIGENDIPLEEKYPIKAKIFDKDLELQEETYYSTIKLEQKGAKIIIPVNQLEILSKVSYSKYKDKFFQGATLVPRTLVFFKIEKKKNNLLLISTDRDILSRAKKKWNYYFQNKEIEVKFHFKTFLNRDLIPFFLKKTRNVFLPVNDNLEFDSEYLNQNLKAISFYKEINEFYCKNKKKTSDIDSIFLNLNYWNKLTKQNQNKNYLVIYNASGSNLKAAVINNREQRIIVSSENYYYSTDSKDEAYYLSAILNSPILSKNIKLIKSSRHIHKRPFSFPIPIYNESNKHKELARQAIKCETIAQDLFMKNPNINTIKLNIIINHKLKKINKLVEQIVFKRN
ncbi:MAG: hypothetical protein EU529_07500 [Promethearchaeota archaeon]|nr:MAG: hypothetical protein EU529_07500 [Candidatus Lokiarchaeota archaeon]